jgi:hypothetical protein
MGTSTATSLARARNGNGSDNRGDISKGNVKDAGESQGQGKDKARAREQEGVRTRLAALTCSCMHSTARLCALARSYVRVAGKKGAIWFGITQKKRDTNVVF